MFTDADFPAVPYPGARPPGSYVHDARGGLPLTPDPAGWRVAGVDLDSWLAARECAPLAARVPVLSYGSNACPSKLTWLRGALGLHGPVVVLHARCEGLAAVWAAGLRVVDGQRPVVLAALPGVVEEHAVLMLTPDQLRVVDTCEGRGDRYQLARVASGRVTLADGAVLDRVPAYVGRSDRRRPLLVDGAPVRCFDVPQSAAVTLVGHPATSDGLDTEVLTGPPDPDSFPSTLFVYGTLQPGATAWPLLAPHAAGPPRPAHLSGTLFDTGLGYPALRLGDGPGVPGRQVRLRTPTALAALDEYEGAGYARVRAVLADGTQCWTYIWTGPVDGMTPLTTPWPIETPMG
ncbi:gamma-glutamylcyclotransferase family protein [Actinokineospora sp.]|uniref:gamma-glutamylcyclotransferase family protein n=1 Tax=Actinokineospora sp. TaxID=1872133 RepID=UPI0040376F70